MQTATNGAENNSPGSCALGIRLNEPNLFLNDLVICRKDLSCLNFHQLKTGRLVKTNHLLATGVREWTLSPEAREVVLMNGFQTYIQIATGKKKNLI